MIRELGKGRYEVVVYLGRDAQGRKRNVSRTVRGTKAEARRLEAKLLLQAHGNQDDAAASAPLSAVLDHWLEQIRPTVEASTYVGYEQKVRLYLIPELGDVPLADLTRTRINEAYRNLAKRTTRRKSPLSPTTIHHCHAVLHAALEYARDDEWITRNPATRAQVPPVARGTVNAPDEQQVAALLRAAQHPDEDRMLYPLVVLAVATGARRGVICGLRWTDVDLDRRTVVYRRALTDADGLAEKGPKAGRAKPKAVGPATVDALKAWRTVQKAKALELGVRVPDDGWVFSWDGRTPIAPGTMSKRFARLAERAGVKVRLHDFRHFSVTTALGSGVSVRDVAERHDHASARMTLDVYADAIPAADRQISDVLDRVVRKAR